jgi:hypothetical protein
MLAYKYILVNKNKEKVKESNKILSNTDHRHHPSKIKEV